MPYRPTVLWPNGQANSLGLVELRGHSGRRIAGNRYGEFAPTKGAAVARVGAWAAARTAAVVD